MLHFLVSYFQLEFKYNNFTARSSMSLKQYCSQCGHALPVAFRSAYLWRQVLVPVYFSTERGRSENHISSLKWKLGSWSGKYQPSPNQNLCSQFLEPPFPSLQQFLPKLLCLSHLLSLVLTSGYFLWGAHLYTPVFLLVSGSIVQICTDTAQIWGWSLKW